MKNLTKFFVAVAALFVGVSCSTDPTEDLGQQIVGEGQTVITVSTGESVLDTKTSLGDKVNGNYPIYWSEGDQLSLNGVKSSNIVIAENGKTATFTWEGKFDAPYCLAYPAGDKGTVTFAAEQSYVEGTFAQNAVPMVGYAAESVSTLDLQYLAGVLQFNVSGAATLASMIVETVDGTPIAGVFDCNWVLNEETGVVEPQVKAQAGSRSSIEYSFGEAGLNIANGASFHVAVPAGKYDAVKVIMLDANGAAFEGTLKADENAAKGPIAPGQVREFTVAYKANKNYTVIKDVETLAAFAKNAATVAEAVVLKDIDASSLAATWAPIEGFAGLLRGNGKTISGLTKPLFGTLHGTVTNLTLDSTIVNGDAETETDKSKNFWGTFAKKMLPAEVEEGQTAPTPSLVSCVTKGTFTVNNTTYKATSNNIGANEFAFGGLVGYAEGALIKNCTNNMVFESKSLSLSHTGSAGKWPVPQYGGVVGAIKNTTVEGCVNTGEFKWNEKSSESNYIFSLQYGGVVGYAYEGTGTISNCKNYGALTINQSTRTTAIGGVVGATSIDVSDCENHGAFTANPSATDGLRYMRGWGGVIGYAPLATTKITRCHNFGDITIGKKVYYYTIYLGGVIGRAPTSGVSVTYCKNYGTINLSGKKAHDTGDNSTHFYVGGVGGHVYGSGSYCENHGDITIAGDGKLRNGTDINSDPYNLIGGVFGKKNGGGATGMKNYGDIIVSAPFDAVEITAGKKVDLFVAGVSANTTSSLVSCENHGNITVSSELNALIDCRVAGIACRNSGGITKCTNSGDIEYSGKGGSQSRVAGCLTYCSAASHSLTNTGNITYSGETASTVRVAGVVAYSSNTIGSASGTGTSNSGTIKITGKCSANNTYIAGVGAYVEKAMTNTSNSGAILYAPTESAAETVRAAGVVAYAKAAVSGENTGSVKIAGPSAGSVYLGGVVGYGEKAMADSSNTGSVEYATEASGAVSIYTGGLAGYNAEAINDSTNNGPVTVAGSFNFAENGSSIINIGGAGGRLSGALTNVTNDTKGILTVSSDLVVPATEYLKEGATKTTSNWGGFAIGGVAGMAANALSGVSNAATMNITSNIGAIPTTTTTTGEGENAKETTKNNYDMHPLVIGGAVAYMGNANSTDVSNSGKITISGTHSYNTDGLFVGGVQARSANNAGYTYDKFVNSGDIEISTVFEDDSPVLVVSGVVSYSCGVTYTNSYNSGNITITDKTSVKNQAFISGFGYATSANSSFEKCGNKGKITVNGYSYEYAAIGGVFASINRAVSIVDCYNEGEIVFAGTAHTTEGARVAGLSPLITNAPTVTGFKNSGNININKPVKYVGGITCYLGASADDKNASVANMTDITNSGNINYNCVADSGAKPIYVAGGICRTVKSYDTKTEENVANALADDTILDWHNKGNITVAAGQTVGFYAGGVAGLSVNPIKGCSNTGNVTVQTSDTACNVGLINGQQYVTTYPVTYCLVQGTILRNGMTAPVTVDETNFFTYAVGKGGTAENLSTCSATTMPEIPAEE